LQHTKRDVQTELETEFDQHKSKLVSAFTVHSRR